MAISPNDWSVVIVGRWNRAILTPSGIARRLFRLQDTPVEVLVPLDTIGPPQVKYERMTVVAGSDRLIILPEVCEYSQLEKAMVLGTRALQNLPETPLTAVGINVKCRAAQSVEALQLVSRKTEFDNRLSDNDLVISGRSITRTLNWKGGRLNLTIGEEEGNPFEILFNFELRSSDRDRHVDWLRTNVQDIQDQVDCILYKCIQIEQEN